MRAIITVVGEDRTGIICRISTTLANAQVNILDISQTILQGYFTMMMVVDLSQITISTDELREQLAQDGEALGVVIKMQHEDIFKAMHRV